MKKGDNPPTHPPTYLAHRVQKLGNRGRFTRQTPFIARKSGGFESQNPRVRRHFVPHLDKNDVSLCGE